VDMCRAQKKGMPVSLEFYRQLPLVGKHFSVIFV